MRAATDSMNRHCSDAAPHGGDRVLRVRVEIEAEPLAVLAVAARRSSTASSSVSMNAVAPTMLSSSNVPQPGVRVHVAEQALGGEHGRVLGQALAVHDQVLPVHVDPHVVEPVGRAACG